MPCLEAAASAESVHNIVYSENHVAKDPMLLPNLVGCQRVDVHRLLWADYGIVSCHALPEEEFVKFVDFVADSEDAFVIPEVVQIVAADPFLNVLVVVLQMSLETCTRGESCCQLLSRNQGVPEEFELVLFFLEQVLQHHLSICLVLCHQIETHLVCVYS